MLLNFIKFLASIRFRWDFNFGIKLLIAFMRVAIIVTTLQWWLMGNQLWFVVGVVSALITFEPMNSLNKVRDEFMVISQTGYYKYPLFSPSSYQYALLLNCYSDRSQSEFLEAGLQVHFDTNPGNDHHPQQYIPASFAMDL